ncbi:hypothetical protein DID88_005073 [Monilinia fructigena]|uniref:Phosphomannomutase n=1 Tax=Monilinia fructigena TaxID=38457 RepID=A0A395ISD6_9HELO|nr:hypothetical protein DID88_005073 [Monilinia fructigena]
MSDANTICLFDVDGTLSPARLSASAEMLSLLAALRQKCAIGYVGGSDMAKQQEQLGTAEIPVTSLFDFCFAENGLTAFKSGVPLQSNSFIKWIGETQYKELVSFILHYVADLDIPPIGRNASVVERNEYEVYDKEHHIREKFIEALKEKFSGLDLTYSIGGQISFDVFPTGWDKTYCLQHLENDAKRPGGIEYTTIHFFGDKTYKGEMIMRFMRIRGQLVTV